MFQRRLLAASLQLGLLAALVHQSRTQSSCTPFTFPSVSHQSWRIHETSAGGARDRTGAANRHNLVCAPAALADQQTWSEGLPGGLSRQQQERGVAHQGLGGRMDAFLQKLMSGQAVKVTVVGGSISAGQGSIRERSDPRAVGAYALQFFRWMNATFPHPQHAYSNGAVPASKSSYMEICLNWHVDPDVDLVLVEYALNDGEAGHIAEMERLVRKVLLLPRAPVVVVVNFFLYNAVTHLTQGWDWTFGPVDKYAELARYYNIPAVSFRDATFHAAHAERAGFLMPEQGDDNHAQDDKYFLEADRAHPNQRGHTMAAQLLVRLVQQAVTHAVLYPPDQARTDPPLPVPMLPGNFASKTVGCYFGKAMGELVVERAGFEWVNDAHEKALRAKWGLSSTSVGDIVSMKLNTMVNDVADAVDGAAPAAPTGGGDHEAPVSLAIGMLRSYERMGVVEMSCSGGCRCECAQGYTKGCVDDKTSGHMLVDGIWDAQDTQVHVLHVSATQAAECMLQFRNHEVPMDRVQKSWTKVKVMSIMLSKSHTGAPEVLRDWKDSGWLA